MFLKNLVPFVCLLGFTVSLAYADVPSWDKIKERAVQEKKKLKKKIAGWEVLKYPVKFAKEKIEISFPRFPNELEPGLFTNKTFYVEDLDITYKLEIIPKTAEEKGQSDQANLEQHIQEEQEWQTAFSNLFNYRIFEKDGFLCAEDEAHDLEEKTIYKERVIASKDCFYLLSVEYKMDSENAYNEFVDSFKISK